MAFRVNKATYAAAVAELVELATSDSGGSKVAAQVLLSAYDGSNYQVDIEGMGNLDRHYHDLAMTVIQGRYDTGWEPHSLIEDGSKIFRWLRDYWYQLHVAERGKETCSTCDGRGFFYSFADIDDEGTACPRCRGAGRVCRCKEAQ